LQDAQRSFLAAERSSHTMCSKILFERLPEQA
jgi:hypothetical protein